MVMGVTSFGFIIEKHPKIVKQRFVAGKNKTFHSEMERHRTSLLVHLSKSKGRFRFCSIQGGDKHTANGTAGILQGLILSLGYISGFEKQFQPIFRLVAFFLGNFQLGNEVSGAVCILGLVEIGSNGGARAQQLIGQDGLPVGRFDLAAQGNDFFCKHFRFVAQRAGRHTNHLIESKGSKSRGF